MGVDDQLNVDGRRGEDGGVYKVRGIVCRSVEVWSNFEL